MYIHTSINVKLDSHIPIGNPVLVYILDLMQQL